MVGRAASRPEVGLGRFSKYSMFLRHLLGFRVHPVAQPWRACTTQRFFSNRVLPNSSSYSATASAERATDDRDGHTDNHAGKAEARAGMGARASEAGAARHIAPCGAAGAGAWDTEKPRERSRERGKQRARHGMECGWAKGARVLARFRRQGAGRGGGNMMRA